MLVTGSSRGIGRAIALRLANEGARVGVHCRARTAEAEAVAAAVRQTGTQACVLQADLRQEQEVQELLRRCAESLGGLDVLVNNAAVEHEQPIEALEEALWEDTFAVNVKGVFFCCRAAVREMLPRPPGAPAAVIINISSRFGQLGDPNSLAYGASKAALNNLTKALAKRYAPQIRVCAVAPAYTPTEMMAHASEGYRAAFQRATPLERFTRPEDTAAAVAFLASEDASFTTGAILPVDGGYSLK